MPIRIPSVAAKSGQVLQLGRLTVLIGANNSGKSQTLRDISRYLTTGSGEDLIVLSRIDAKLPTKEEAMSSLVQREHPAPGHVTLQGVGLNLRSKEEFTPHRDWISTSWHDPSNETNRAELLRHLGKYWIAHLDAESRFHLSEPTPSYDLRQDSPSNGVQAFFKGGAQMQNELRSAFRSAFRKDIALDWAAMGKFYLRIAEDFGTIPNTLPELDRLMRDKPELSNQGDGYRSFAGIVLAKLAFPDRLLLLDEPEAFLHPSQARAMGKWLAEHSQRSATQVVLATHSADLLWGIVSSTDAATIVRLNRKADTTTFHRVPIETSKKLVETPLLSSQPVLEALFQKGVIVCEGDPDRAIYQSAAHQRCQSFGGDEIAFVHSNGKDAVKTPVQLFKESGTPVAAIVDFDIINSENVFLSLYKSIAGEEAPEFLSALRSEIAEFVEAKSEFELLRELEVKVSDWVTAHPAELRAAKRTLAAVARNISGWDRVKASGIRFFDEGSEMRSKTVQLLDACSKIGLFIVPNGELESWSPKTNPKGHSWNRSMLEDIALNKCSNDFVSFVSGAVKFIGDAETA